MADSTRELVVLVTHGADHELSSVAFTIANGGITAGLSVSVFLTSAAVDLVRKRAIDSTVVAPLEPLAALTDPAASPAPISTRNMTALIARTAQRTRR